MAMLSSASESPSKHVPPNACVASYIYPSYASYRLIAIYDVHLKLTWLCKSPDESELEGTLDIPEVSHEITLDQQHDYTYNWESKGSTSESTATLYTFIRERLPTALETKLAEFPAALMDTHGKDITISASASQEPSRSNTPAIPGSAATEALPTAHKDAVAKAKGKQANTTTLTIDASFMASADDLFSMLTDEKRIPQWSRNSAMSNPTAGSSYTLFGGNVKGVYSSVARPTGLVQTWALSNPNWPAGHFASLTTTFDQSSDSTKVTWTMTGVPVGMEDEIKYNLQGYYIGGLNSIGLGSMGSTL